MRKHVKPADRGASIPDPERGRDLPPEGREVEWNAHWAGLELRKDIVVKDVADEPAKRPEAARERKAASRRSRSATAVKKDPMQAAQAVKVPSAAIETPHRDAVAAVENASTQIGAADLSDEELDRLTQPNPDPAPVS